MLASPLAKAETSTVTISSSGDAKLTSTPDDSLIVMNLNRGYLYGSTTLNSSFDVLADVQIDSLIISDGYKQTTYHFSGDISGAGTFERTSDAKGANQTYVFTGDMSAYSGEMKLSKANDGNSFKFIGNQSGTGNITIAAGNSITVDGAVMNNSSITSAGTFTVSGNSVFTGNVASTGTLNVNGSVSFEGAVYSNGSLVLGADAMLTNKGSFTFGEEVSINLVRAVAAEDAQRTLTYTILTSAGTGTSNLSSLSLERIVGIQSVGRNWSFNDDGTLVGVLNNHALSYAGGNLTWNTTTAAFSNGSETVAFTNGDDVTFSGTSAVTLGESLSVQRLTVANGAEVTISGDTGSLALAEAVVNGTLKLNKGGQNGAFSGNVDVYGTLSVETGDVTGWSGTDGIKSIDVFAGGEMYVAVTNNQTGAGLSINLQGGSISGVSGANFDLGYGGAIYGYSSISALAADDATAETPTVSTISGTNLTLRQNHTTISVAENARLDISSGILVKGNKSDLNGEGAVPSHLQAGLVKTGAGELRLSGNNTYTQATTVAEGTLTLTGGASMASASISVNDGAFFHLTTESGLSASVSGVLSGNGTLRKTGLGSASIGGLSDSFAGHIDLQQGTLSVGSPVVISSGRELSLGMTGAVLNSNLSLGDGRLSIDYSGSGAATSLNNSALTLLGGTQLQLSSLGNGDGKTYELFAGIGSLLGRDGNALVLDDTNNAISNYFDSTRPGSGFWTGGTLQLTNAGTLQLVLHDETVKVAQTITARQTNPSAYQYYASIAFEDISYVSDSNAGGGAIYGDEDSTITLSDNGCVVFEGNTASYYGGAIYGGSSSTITLSNNGTVTFIENTAKDGHGGAIYGKNFITLSNNGSVEFTGNTASYYGGGAIYGYSSSTITLSNNSSVMFMENLSFRGGAIYGDDGCTISLSENESVLFTGNSASYYGGAIYGQKENIVSLSNNGTVTFIENTAKDGHGGAICGYINGTITLSNNGTVTFSENSSSSCGGAIYGGSITLNNNGSVLFYGNLTSGSYSAEGGAIGGASDITLTNNSSVTFCDNSAYSGGAIDGNADITLTNNSSMIFSENSALSAGGAIYGGAVTLSNNGSVIFGENAASSSSASAYGGAIFGDDIITISYNSSVIFRGNSVSASSSADGGAVWGGGAINLIENGSVIFSDNSASDYGGAIYGNLHSSITACNNKSIIFNGNLAYSGIGGAICAYSDITMSGNGSIIFNKNVATTKGGAIYTSGNLNIRNNDSVEFYQNAEVKNGSYQLRSIYAEGSGDVIYLSAAEGKSIKFRDSIYIASGSTFNLNETCGEIEQKGDIIFTGATTEADLLAVKGSAGTAEEILASRTSEVYALTNLYGGRLCVEDGAVYKGYGVTAHEGSSATVLVKNAELQHKGYEFSFHAGTTLELAGNNTIIGDVQMLEGSTLCFDGGETKGTTSLTGNLSFASNADIALQNGSNWTGQNEILLYVDGSVSGWDDRYLGENSDIRWVNGELLVLNYNKETFNPWFRGDIVFSKRQTDVPLLKYYNSVRFENITASSSGGAIYGRYSSTIELSNNGNVSFIGNSASSSGGAIYGSSSSTIELSNNGSVVFEGNTASGSSSAYGGAIYAYGNLSIQNNGAVEFCQNAEVSNGSYRLRSIYAGGSGDVISLSAAEGKNITFRDSVYIASGSTFNLNETYGDREQKGDIIFTGSTTENDLYEVKGNVDGTESEILASRTSEVYTMTNLYGGRLRVEDGAIYLGQGITVHEGSEATVRVKDAELNHAGYEMSFNAGTSLEVAGESTIRGNVALKEGSLFKLEQGAVLCLHEMAEADAAILTVNGTAFLSGASMLNASLTLADGATLDMDNPDAGAVTLNGALTFGGQVTMGENLLAILLEMSAWGESVTLFTGIESLVLPVMASSEASNRVWVGDVFSNLVGYEQYYFNYVPDVGSLMVVHVPEPTTTTLGLLTLAGLALRRRRK